MAIALLRFLSLPFALLDTHGIRIAHLVNQNPSLFDALDKLAMILPALSKPNKTEDKRLSAV